MKKLLLTFSALTILSAPALAAGPTSYQVTGPVLALTDTTITVQKDTEKWQIARGGVALTPDVKVGSKVTIQYVMSATSITAKPVKK